MFLAIDIKKNYFKIQHMTHEIVNGTSTPQPRVERNATAILKDGQWHYANFCNRANVKLTSDNYTPMTIWIDGESTDPFKEQTEHSKEESHRLIFERNKGSWGRDGGGLICGGKASIDDQELPVALLVTDTGSFLKISQQADSYRAPR
jgi:hypothetical protein